MGIVGGVPSRGLGAIIRCRQGARAVYRGVLHPLSFLVALPFIVMSLVSDRACGNATQGSVATSRIPFMFGEIARWFYYRTLLLSVGSDVTFIYGSSCQYRKARIGTRVLVGHFAMIGEVSIGDDVLIGGNVNILSGLREHRFDDPTRRIWDTPAEGRRMIRIGSDVWIGSNAVIGSDIGDRCVVAVGSVVVKEVESHSLVGSNPARVIREI